MARRLAHIEIVCNDAEERRKIDEKTVEGLNFASAVFFVSISIVEGWGQSRCPAVSGRSRFWGKEGEPDPVAADGEV